MKSPFKQNVQRKAPKIPDLNEELSDGVVQWFAKRGISAASLDIAGVESGDDFIAGE